MPELPVLKGDLDDLYILLALGKHSLSLALFFTDCIHIKLAYRW